MAQCAANGAELQLAAGASADQTHVLWNTRLDASDIQNMLEIEQMLVAGEAARPGIWMKPWSRWLQGPQPEGLCGYQGWITSSEKSQNWDCSRVSMAFPFCGYRVKRCINTVAVAGSAWNRFILLPGPVGSILLLGGPFLSTPYIISEHDLNCLPSGRKKGNTQLPMCAAKVWRDSF